MASKYHGNVSQSCENAPRPSTTSHIILSGVDVVRDGRAEPFLDSRPIRSGAPAQWGGIALENYAVPAVFIPLLFVKTSCAILCVREHTTFSESGAAAETAEPVKRRQLGRDESVTHAVLITIGVIARIGGIIGVLNRN
jgi:hypothetical protein